MLKLTLNWRSRGDPRLFHSVSKNLMKIGRITGAEAINVQIKPLKPIPLSAKYSLEPEAQFSSVAQSRPILCNPMNRSTPGLPVHHQLPEFTQTHVHWVSDAIQPSHPLLLLPPIPPSIRVFSNESTLCMRWPKYWSFSFSISPSNEHAGLISFRMDWLNLLAVQGTLKSLLWKLVCPKCE